MMTTELNDCSEFVFKDYKYEIFIVKSWKANRKPFVTNSNNCQRTSGQRSAYTYANTIEYNLYIFL
jgi:hypothetical protein